MEDEFRQPIWIKRPPHVRNRRIHPCIRHPSRLFTPAVPFQRPNDFYSQAQLRMARNSSTAHPQLLMFLNDSKNLFSRQLPNMGAAYISRLVFDFNAESVFILHNGIVTGAICSRIFFKEEFIEIVFLAVDTKMQSKGYGRLAMNYLKSLLQIYPLYDMLACADNEAVTYFQKQGFNDKGIFMDPSRWVGRIKDYDGVTLVHCQIHPGIDYMNFHKVIDRQIQFVEKVVGKHFILPHKDMKSAFLSFKESPTFVSVPLSQIIENTDNKLPRTDKDKDKIDHYNKTMDEYRTKLTNILNELENDERLKSIFQRPVTEDLAPTYFEAIKRPMDFWTIRKRLIRFLDFYKRPEMFAADIQQIVDNCKQFNQPGTIYVNAANSLYSKFRDLYRTNFPNHPL